MKTVKESLDLMLAAQPKNAKDMVFVINPIDHLKLCIETRSLALRYKGVKIHSVISVRNRFRYLMHESDYLGR